MAQSEAQIVNAALTYIGHTQFVDDLDDSEDDSAERAIAVQAFDTDRDFVLRAADWPFATARAQPAQITETTLALGEVPGGWGYAFAMPADSVKIRGLFTVDAIVRNPREDTRVKYVIEYDSALQALVILTDEPTPEIVYTSHAVSVEIYPPDFEDALAWKLAIKLAAGLRKDPATVRDAVAGYRQAMAIAISGSGQESRGDSAPPAPDWIAER